MTNNRGIGNMRNE